MRTYKLTHSQSVTYYNLPYLVKIEVGKALMAKGISKRVMYRNLSGEREMKLHEYEAVKEVLSQYGIRFVGSLSMNAGIRFADSMAKIKAYRESNRKKLEEYKTKKLVENGRS